MKIRECVQCERCKTFIERNGWFIAFKGQIDSHESLHSGAPVCHAGKVLVTGDGLTFCNASCLAHFIADKLNQFITVQ